MGTPLLPLSVARFSIRRSIEAGTTIVSLRLEARRGLANAVRLSGARKMTVLRRRFELKRVPRMLIALPTCTRIGDTSLIVEACLALAADAGPAWAPNAVTRSATSASESRVGPRSIAVALSAWPAPA